MADTRGDASIIIGADDAPFQAAMKNVQKTAQEAMAKVGGHIQGLGGVLDSIQGKFIAFAAVIAGGAAFGKAINDTTKFTGEVVQLSKQLGITTEEASGLNVALGDIGSDADSYTTALQKLTKQVRTNEAGLNAMGIATRDSNGQFLNGRALMDSALNGLKQYKEGTDRNLAAQVAFGKGAAESAKLLKLTAEIQDEAAKKAQALGLVIGTENVEAVKKYKLAMNEVGDVLLAINKVIGDAIIPVLTRLGEWFSDGGPAAVAIFKEVAAGIADVLSIVADTFIELWNTGKEALSAIASLFVDEEGSVKSFGDVFHNVFVLVRAALLTLKAGFVIVFETIRGAIEVIVGSLRTFANVAIAAFRLDFAGVQSAWATGTKNIERIVLDSAKRIYDKTMATGQQIADALAGNVTPRAGSGVVRATGSRSFVDPKAGKGGRLEDTSKAEYAVAKAQFEAALALQKEYLKEAQSAYDDAYRNNLVDIRGYYAARQAIEEKQIDLEIAARKLEIEAIQKAERTAATDRERLTLKAQEIKLTGELTVMEAQRAQVAVTVGRELTAAERQRNEALANLRIQSQINIGNSELAIERINLDTRRALRQTSDAQAIEEERGFEDRVTAIQRKAVEDRIALEQAGTRDPVKLRALNDELEQLERVHQEHMVALDSQATIERQRNAITLRDSIENSLGTLLNDFANHTKKLKDIFKDFFASITKDINKFVSEELKKALFGAGTTGGGLIDQLVKGISGKSGGGVGGIFGTGAAVAGAAGSTASNDAMGDFIKQLGVADSGLKDLSTGGIGGMISSAGALIQKTIYGTVIESAQATATSSLTTMFAALTAAVQSATSSLITMFAALTAAVQSATAALAALGATGGSGSGGSLLGAFFKSGGSSGAAGPGLAAGDTGAFDSGFTSILAGIGSFAVGTNYVPRNMLAKIHRGERIVPASQNTPGALGNRTVINNISVDAGTSRETASQIARRTGLAVQASLARDT